MVSDRVLEGLRLTPDDVAAHEFAHGFRGYDVHEVRSFLRLVAGEMGRLSEDVDRVSARLDEESSRNVDTVAKEQVSDLVGGEAAKVLQAAEDAAAQIRQRAEENVERMLREARSEAAELRTSADQRRADTIVSSEGELAAARDEAAAILATAEVDAQKRRDAAVTEGRAMLAQAHGAKDSVLGDLARKRGSLRRELAQLRAGIDQLQESYDELRSMLDTSSLVVDEAVDNARRAAADAAHRFDRADDEDDLVEVRAVVDATDGHDTTAPPHPVAEEPAEVEPVSETPVSTEQADGELATANVVVPDGDEAADPEPVSADADVDDDDLEDAGVDGVGGSASEVPSVEQAAAVRATEHRVIHRRSARPDDDAEVDEGASDVEDVDDSDDVVDAPALDELTDDRPDLPDLLDDGPVPEAPEPPPLTGRGDTDIDELFARIRSSRDDAVAEAEAILAADDSRSSDDEPSATHDDAGVDDPSPDTSNVGVGPVSSTEALDAETAEAVPMRHVDAFGELDAAVDEIAPQVARVLKRALAEQLNEVLDASRRADDDLSIDELIAPGADEHYGESVADLLSAAASAGAGGSGTADITSATSVVSAEIGGALRTRIEGYLPGDEGLDQRIRGAFREWRRERADEVARDAVIAAFDIGLLSALGSGAAVRWLQRDTGCKHADCGDNALADDVTVGQPFPTGHVTAPLAPGCRCLVVGSDK